MRKVPVEDAVGLPLGHDITEISREKHVKRRAFRRGHVIRSEDVEKLRDLGKNVVFVEEANESAAGPILHEDDAALAVAPLAAGRNIEHDAEPSEGKIRFRATCRGLFRVDVERLYAINSLAIPALPTIRTNFPVEAGRTVATFRIIPLTCERAIIDRTIGILTEPERGPLLNVLPYRVRTAGIVVTGDEVYEGRITDGFVPRLTETLAAYDVPVIRSEVLPDDRGRIAAAVAQAADECDLVLVTGGTSVDPDDVTVGGMNDAGVGIVTQGAPLQPGNNFTIGYRGDTPVCAVPAAALFFRATALDVFLPRLLAGVRISREEIFGEGHGGLCLQCGECTFPVCTFGQGG